MLMEAKVLPALLVPIALETSRKSVSDDFFRSFSYI